MNMMHPLVIVMIVVTLPAVFFLLLFGPIYMSICASAYFYYGDEVAQYFYNSSYMLEIANSVYHYWGANSKLLGFSDFILPVFGPVIIGTLFGFFLCFLFGRFLRNIFTV